MGRTFKVYVKEFDWEKRPVSVDEVKSHLCMLFDGAVVVEIHPPAPGGKSPYVPPLTPAVAPPQAKRCGVYGKPYQQGEG